MMNELLFIQSKKIAIMVLLLIALPTSFSIAPSKSSTQNTPIVHAVLFYSPTCPHCLKVINEVLPPLTKKYGSKLDILFVNVTTKLGQSLFITAMDNYQELKEQPVVPALVIGNTVLIGSLQIPDQFPDLIEEGISQDGKEWPAITGLNSFIRTEGSQLLAQGESQDKSTPLISVTTTPNDENNITNGSSQGSIILQKFRRDLVGNSLAVIVLLGMVVSVLFIIYRFFSASESYVIGRIPFWVIPILCLIGLGVASYLTYVETSHVKAVCGPVGDCNSVQQSPYATLWGVMPVGVFGILGYMGIGFAWVVYQFNVARQQSIGALAMWGMALLGTLFSIYLTFLEPFVIGATCIWCITSAIVITLLLWITTGPALQVSMREIEEDDDV